VRAGIPPALLKFYLTGFKKRDIIINNKINENFD
jgi:hypothetical protein